MMSVSVSREGRDEGGRIRDESEEALKRVDAYSDSPLVPHPSSLDFTAS
jgi:hypothetical protein